MNTSKLTPTNLPGTTGQAIRIIKNMKITNVNKFINHIESDLLYQKQQKRLDQELHHKRVQNLKRELDYLKATEWKYRLDERNVDQTYRY